MLTLGQYSFYKLKKTTYYPNRIVAIVYNRMCDNKKKQQSKISFERQSDCGRAFCFHFNLKNEWCEHTNCGDKRQTNKPKFL